MTQDLGYLRQSIENRNVILFLGAGASIPAGAPSGPKLAEMLCNEFLKGQPNCDNLFEVGDRLDSTPHVSRLDVDQFIRDRLKFLKPAAAHCELTKHPWICILTTNFDDLIEKAYESQARPRQVPIEVYLQGEMTRYHDPRYVHILHLNGGIRNQQRRLVLSHYDLHESRDHREWMLEPIAEYSGSAKLLFIGYSFTDLIITNFLSDILKEYGPARVPIGYAILPNLSSEQQQRLAMFRISGIRMGFEEFGRWLEDESPAIRVETYKTITVPDSTGNSATRQVRIPESDAIEYQNEFAFLHDELVHGHATQTDPAGFFRGEIGYFEHYRNRRDVIRDGYHDWKSKIVASLRRPGALDHNSVFSIVGSPGNGRSVVLRRLAYDLYVRERMPVIFLRDLPNYDSAKIERFIDSLGCKPLVIVEDPSDLGEAAYRLAKKLKNRSVSVDFLFSWRQGVVDLNAGDSFSNIDELLENYDIILWSRIVKPSNRFYLRDELTETELRGLAQRLRRAGIPRTRSKSEAQIIREIIDVYNSSFFVTMLVYLDGHNNQFRSIVLDEYERLVKDGGGKSVAQQCYDLVSLGDVFGIPILSTAVRRYLGITRSQLDSLLNGELAGLVFQEVLDTGERYLRTRHKVIASVIFEEHLADRRVVLDMLCKLAHSLDVYAAGELGILHSIRKSNALAEYLGPELKRDFYRVAHEVAPQDHVLTHHLAIAELEVANYPEAERLLNELTSSSPRAAYFHTKSLLLQHKSRKASLEGDEEQAQAFMLDGLNAAVRVIELSSTSSYGYHSFATIQYKRAVESPEPQRLQFISEALAILDQGLDQVDEDDKHRLISVRRKCFELIGREDKLLAEYERTIHVAGKRGAEDYLHAQLLLTKNPPEPKRAFDLVSKMLESGDTSFSAKRLYAKCLKALGVPDKSKYREVLQELYRLRQDDLWVVFQLACVYFTEGALEQSLAMFQRSSRISEDHPARHELREYFADSKTGERKLFRGVIKPSDSAKLGRVYCPLLETELIFDRRSNPLGNNFTNRPVEFQIAFTYIGPRAVKLRLI